MSKYYICKERRLSAETICQDLQVLILKRLPVKALLRCRCVCKSWKEIIASKCFVLDHLAIQRPRLIAQNDCTKYLLLDASTLPWCDTLSCPDQFHLRNRCSFVVVGGVHGVLCLYNFAERVFLWNPSTRQSMRIKLGGPRASSELRYCGFWIDPSNDEFKIVIFRPMVHGSATLFSSRKPEAWTEVDGGRTLLGCAGIYNSLQVVIGGVAHWLAYTNFNTHNREKIILLFDFMQEKFGAIKAPDGLQPSKRPFNAKLCKWQGLLSLVDRGTCCPYQCDIWAMQHGSWSKMFSFNLIKGIREVHCVLEDWGRVVVSDEFLSKELLYYDSKERCTIPLEPKFPKLGDPFVACEFVESLVFPDPKCFSSESLILLVV